MKGICTVIILAGVLVGCSTTPQKMRDAGPDEVHTSFKSPKEIFLCFAPEWEEYVVVNARETKSGYSVTGIMGTELKYMADIDQVDQGSKTKLYTFKVIEIGRDPLLGAVTKCQ